MLRCDPDLEPGSLEAFVRIERVCCIIPFEGRFAATSG
jgi:hypothetical protein